MANSSTHSAKSIGKWIPKINVDAMIPNKKYKGNKQGTLSFIVIPSENMENERALMAIKNEEIMLHKRKAEQIRIDAEKKAERDARYAKLFLRLTIRNRDLYAQNKYK